MVSGSLLSGRTADLDVLGEQSIGSEPLYEVNHYMISSERIPEAFDGFRITHLSDLHNEEFGKDNEKLLALVRDSEPDMIPVRFNNRPEVIAITLKKN